MYILKNLKIVYLIFFCHATFASTCLDYLLISENHALKELNVRSYHSQDSIFAAKMNRSLSKLNSDDKVQLLKALSDNQIYELVLISEGFYIEGNTLYFSEDSLEIFYNGQLLLALQLRLGLKRIFPELEISVNPFFVPLKIDVEALLDYFGQNQVLIRSLYPQDTRNVFSIGYFTHYSKARRNSKSKTVITEAEINISPGFVNAIKGLFQPKTKINKNYLDMQLDAIYRNAKYGQPIMWVPD